MQNNTRRACRVLTQMLKNEKPPKRCILKRFCLKLYGCYK